MRPVIYSFSQTHPLNDLNVYDSEVSFRDCVDEEDFNIYDLRDLFVKYAHALGYSNVCIEKIFKFDEEN